MFSAGRSAPVQKSPSVDSCISHLQINCAVAIETAQEPPCDPAPVQMPWVTVQVCAHTGCCGFSSPVWLSLGHSFPPWEPPCTHLASPGCVQNSPTGSTHVHKHREHLFTHSYAHFDNQCRSFQHRGYIINPRYLKYFSFLLHNSHETWPVVFLEHLFTFYCETVPLRFHITWQMTEN